MSLILQPGSAISRSGNIALYPALCSSGDGSAACAWYEYTSPDCPARSDLWFSRQLSDGSWGNAVNISGGVSYNNGPSLTCADKGGFVVAWHSWRPPGREPFSNGGDKYNIWLTRSSDGHSWGGAELPFPELNQTKYAALAIAGGTCFLAFSQQTEKTVYVSSSPDCRNWRPPEPLCNKPSGFPSICSSADGKLFIVFSMPDEKGLWISSAAQGMKWSEPRQVLEDFGGQITKPKISVDSSGSLWIACQTENWGSFTRRFRVAPASEVLEICLETAGGAGNAVWTLNSVVVSRPRGKALRTIRFGPALKSDEPDITRVGSGEWAWNENKACGFDGPVVEILRELGTEVTRGMVYSSSRRTLSVGVSPGEMEIEIIYSSWIAARPALEISFNADFHELDTVPLKGDQCFLFRSQDGEPFELVAETSPREDHSRPSAACEIVPDHYMVAWTSFEEPSVQVVSQTLNTL